jgi:ribosome-associated protein
MSLPHMHQEHETDLDDLPDEKPSKSQRKRDMAALQDLGEELIGLSASALDKIPMTQALRDAVDQAKAIKAHGGRKRQLQYIGKLMREIDAAPIRDALEQRTRQSRESARHFHQLEQLRDRLLQEGETVVDEVCERYPQAERQRLRQLLRQARKEQDLQQPPKSARQLFRYLRELEEGEESRP